MKANELMIGDWVCCTDPTPFKIEAITIIDTPEYVTGSDGFDVEIADLQPIPLTKEILEKNGWENVSDKDAPVMQIEDRNDAFWWDSMNGECGCERSVDNCGEEDFEKNFMCAHICYVHELQHALRLCGIEKEIKL